MQIIEFGRDDLYRFCRNISIKFVSLNEHIDINRIKKEGKIGNHDIYRADMVVFRDDDGSTKVIKRVVKKYKNK